MGRGARGGAGGLIKRETRRGEVGKEEKGKKNFPGPKGGPENRQTAANQRASPLRSRRVERACRICVRQSGRVTARCALAAAWARSSARLPAPPTRDKSPAAAIPPAVALKPPKSRCITPSPSAPSITR